MNADARSAGGHFVTLSGIALRACLQTMFVLTLAGFVLAGVSYFFLRGDHWGYGLIAASVAFVESVAAGVVLGIKRSVVMALAHGLGELHTGRGMVQLVFQRMLKIAEGGAPGDPGSRVARGLERIPLAQAEELLRAAVQSVLGDAEQAGRLRKKLHRWLLGAIQKYTLAKFRTEGAPQGGVDLWKVQAELEQTVDQAMVQKVRSGLGVWTALVIIGLPLVIALQIWLAVALLHAKG